MKCRKEVADFTGYHFHKCDKPAKYLYMPLSDHPLPLCGIHARKFKLRNDKHLKLIKGE